MGIPTVRDRVVQQAMKNVLEPIFEDIFLPQSHGYRPNMDAHGAVRKAEAYLESGYHWIVDADIQGFFDHVDHTLLKDLVCEKISDGRVLSLIESFLKCGIMNEGILEANTADDILIFCNEWEAQNALNRAKEILEGELKLTLSPEKTRIVHGRKKGVEFLGFHFNGRWRRPREKAVKQFKEEIKHRTQMTAA